MHEGREQTTPRWAARLRACVPSFSLSFLGLAAVRVWLQYSVYGMYAATDFGVTTVVTNILRVVVTVALMAVVVRRGFPPRAQGALGVFSVACMTAASVAALAASEMGVTWLAWVACVVGAVGVVWGGGMWITFYQRLCCAEAVLYAFGSLALSCVAGLVLGLVPSTIAALVAAFMPALSLVTFRAAMQALDAREAGDAACAHAPGDVPDRAYDAEPRATFARLLGGVALFNLALGFARGFPFGQAIALSLPFQALHQLGCAALCAAVVWWTLVRGRSLRLSALWDIPLALLVAGVLLLAAQEPPLVELGSALVTVANTLTLAVLWAASQDVARHSSTPGYLVLGAVWIAHQLPRELGRMAVMAVGPHDGSPMLLAVCMVVLLAASMLLLVNDSVPQVRPLFAGLRAWAGPGARPAAHDEREGAPANPRAAAPGSPEAMAGGRPDATEMRLLVVAQRYQLTRRETDIARLLLQGASKAAVGEELCLTESTVRTHARHLYAKLDVHSREQLAQLVREFEE